MAQRKPLFANAGGFQQLAANDQVAMDGGLITVQTLPIWSDSLLSGDATARLNMAGINYFARTLETFGPCGNGVLSQDHAAFTAAMAWCNTRNTTLILSAGKRYLLDFSFQISAVAPRIRAPRFRLEAWGAEIKFTGSGAAFSYAGAYYVDKQDTEYASFAGGTFLPSAAGTQTAISVNLKLNPSTWFKNADILCVDGRIDDMNNQNIYWSSFITFNNVWNASIFGVTASQPFRVYQGVMVQIAGLSAAIRVYHVNGQWWDTGLNFGYATVVGLVGTLNGSFLNGEVVTGSTSQTSAYALISSPVAQNGVTYSLVVADRFGGTGDFSQNGETLTGQTSGATFTLSSSGTASIVIPGESVYASGGEFVEVNTGFNFTCPAAGSAAVRPQIGHQIDNWHVNSNSYGIILANVAQVEISSALLYAKNTDWIGIYINGANEINIGSTVRIHGQGLARTTGIAHIGTSQYCRVDAQAAYCYVGLNVPSNGPAFNDYGMSFYQCTTDANNVPPVTPSANGNSWYRTVSRQAGWVGGYNK